MIFANYSNTAVNFKPGNSGLVYISGWQLEVTVPAGNPDVLIEIGAMISYKNTYGANLYFFRDSSQLFVLSAWARAGVVISGVGANNIYKDDSVAQGTYVYRVGFSASGSISVDMDINSSFIKATILNT